MYLFALPADTVDSITPDKVRGLRDMLNSSAMDIMYYTSPLYRDEVSLRPNYTTAFLLPLRNTPSLRFSLAQSPRSCGAAFCQFGSISPMSLNQLTSVTTKSWLSCFNPT